jgi:hypothetical protein
MSFVSQIGNGTRNEASWLGLTNLGFPCQSFEPWKLGDTGASSSIERPALNA